MALGKGINIDIGKLNFGRELKPPAIIVTSELNVEKECIKLVLTRGQLGFVFIKKLAGWIAWCGLILKLVIHERIKLYLKAG